MIDRLKLWLACARGFHRGEVFEEGWLQRNCWRCPNCGNARSA